MYNTFTNLTFDLNENASIKITLKNSDLKTSLNL